MNMNHIRRINENKIKQELEEYFFNFIDIGFSFLVLTPSTNGYGTFIQIQLRRHNDNIDKCELINYYEELLDRLNDFSIIVTHELKFSKDYRDNFTLINVCLKATKENELVSP